MLVAQFSEFPEPQEGETTCVLSLTQAPNGSYRLRAYTAGDAPRDIGRWMSDCALTVSENALLWVTRFKWQIQQQQGSLDINQVLEIVEHLEPMDPIDPETGQLVHPLDMLASIGANLPPKDVTSLETGAQLQLDREVVPPAPAPGHPVRRGLLSGSVARQQPVARQQSVGPHHQLAAPAPVQPGQPDDPRQLGSEERDLARFMRRMVMNMRQGQPIEDVREAMTDYIDGGDEEELEELQDYPPAVLELAGQLLRANEGLDEENALDQALAIYQAQTVSRFNPGDSQLPALPGNVRPLGPNEAMPGETSPALRTEIDGFGPENEGDRAKLERGWARTASMRRRADAVSPLPSGIRPAVAGAHPLVAPRQSTSVYVGDPTAVPTNGAGISLSREDADRVAAEQIEAANKAAQDRAARSAAHRDAARAEHEAQLAADAAEQAAEIEAVAPVATPTSVPAASTPVTAAPVPQPVPEKIIVGLGIPPASGGAEA